jgi:hypothetical protein
MAVFQLIPAGDLALSGGDFVWQEGIEHTRQVIAARFRFFLGEWFLDLREGVPYYRDVLVKNPDREVVRSVFRNVLKTTPRVLEITRFDLRLDTTTRTLSFDFACQTEDGPIAVSPTDDAFIVRY